MSRMRRLGVNAAACAAWCLALSVAGAEWRLSCEGDLRAGGKEPAEATAVTFAPGRQGQGILLQRGSRLAYDPADLDRQEFSISFWVKHPRPLRDYFYDEMTYVYHETPDAKNRIGFVKRSATSYFVFYLGNAQGGGKGQNFAGDWFALKTPVCDWEAESWHQITLVASKQARRARVVIDGRLCAEASGDQFPEAWGPALWLGSRAGASPVEGVLDEVQIGAPEFADGLARAVPAPFTPPDPQRPSPRHGGKELTMNLDFFDICIGTDCWDMNDCAGEMDRIMRLCDHYDVDRVLFRVSVCAPVCYRSKVVQACNDACFATEKGEIMDTCVGNIPSCIPWMAKVMERIDPLAEAVAAGHRYGIEVWGWSTIFDGMYYAPPGEFFREHPEYTWQSRDGKTFIPGVPCYAYPEVCAYRLGEMREMLEYKVDGLYLCVRSHSPWPARGSREYGYNPPVIEEYRQRYGMDPRQAVPDSLEELRFVQLKGEHLTRFLRTVKTEARKFGKPVAINATWDAVDPVSAARMYVDMDTLAREGGVDELSFIMGAQADLSRWRLLADGKLKLTVFAGIHGESYEVCLPQLKQGITAMLANATSDGACFHELANAYYLDLWQEGIADAYASWGQPAPAR
jgi:hypothetical protein